jgi:hypothetical protein
VQYLNVLLNVPKEEKKSTLQAQLWYPDAPGQWNTVPTVAGDILANPNGNTRKTKIELSAPVFLQGKLGFDLFKSLKPMVEGVSMSVTIIPQDPAKCFLAAEQDPAHPIPELGIEIMMAELIVPRLQPKAVLLHQPAVYTYNKKSVVKFVHTRNTTHFTRRCIHRGPGAPSRVFIVIQPETLFIGDVTRNRWQFKHNDVSEMILEMNENQKVYRTAFREFDYLQPYLGLFQNVEGDTANNISIEAGEFEQAYCIWSFSLTDTKSYSEDMLEPQRSGDVFIRFTQSHPNDDNLIISCILDYTNILTVDKNRNFHEQNLDG